MQTNNKIMPPKWVRALAAIWVACGCVVNDTPQAWAVYLAGVGAFAVVMWCAYGDKLRKEVRNE